MVQHCAFSFFCEFRTYVRVFRGRTFNVLDSWDERRWHRWWGLTIELSCKPVVRKIPFYHCTFSCSRSACILIREEFELHFILHFQNLMRNSTSHWIRLNAIRSKGKAVERSRWMRHLLDQSISQRSYWMTRSSRSLFRGRRARPTPPRSTRTTLCPLFARSLRRLRMYSLKHTDIFFYYY